MYLNKIFTEYPDFRYSSGQIAEILSRHYDSPAASDFITTRIENSGIKFRSFCRDLDEIVSLHGHASRARIFQAESGRLFTKLADSMNAAPQPQALITTSCSVPTVPPEDLNLIDITGIRSNPIRIPVYQHGCIGGVWSLALSARLKLNSIMLCSYELCSLLFQPGSEDLSQMMGAVLFSDGLGAALLSDEPDRPLLQILGSADYVIPETAQLLGYDLMDGATKLVLSPQIPSLLSRHLPDFVRSFLLGYSVAIEDIKQFIVHPGGLKILDELKTAFNLDKNLLASSYSTLADFGNISSASIFSVLSHYFSHSQGSPGDLLLILGVGPGISLQAILCRIP